MHGLHIHELITIMGSSTFSLMTTQSRKFLIACYTGQGHISPTLQFASRLVKLGVDVTICTNISSVGRIDKQTLPLGITFAPFSDGYDDGVPPTTTLQQFFSDFYTKCELVVAELISSATAAGQPFERLVYTNGLTWAPRVANAHGIKSAILWCQSATMIDIYYFYGNGYQSLISSNNDNLTFPIILHGLPPLTIADLSSFMMSSCPKEHEFVLQNMLDLIDLEISPTVLVNTFDELEFEFIRATKKLELIPIGPLVPLEFLEGKNLDDKPKEEYIQWLDTKSESSVVYVSFGTIASLTMEQLEEVANGLLESGKPFLWVIRDGEKTKRLSKLEELENLGMIVGWCSQMVVLRHKAIGCFVTHGGWNSTMESIVAGIPTVVYPQWSDQPNNAKMIQDVWKTGVRLKAREGVLEGKEFSRCVETVTGNEEMKRNAEKWSALAREALTDGGSSTINLRAFLENA